MRGNMAERHEPNNILLKYLTNIFGYVLVIAPLMGNVISTNGRIDMIPLSNSIPSATLNSTGFGIGITPSANLHVSGNAIISGDLSIGSTSPSQSTLSVHGTFALAPLNVSSNIFMNIHSLALCDTSAGNIDIQLSPHGNTVGRMIVLKKITTNNCVSVYDSAGGNIDGVNYPIVLSSGSTGSIKLISSANTWHIMDGAQFERLIIFQAESGQIGSNYTSLVDPPACGGNVLVPNITQYGNSPNAVANIITYSLPMLAGSYDLYARIIVGEPGTLGFPGGDSDSMFSGNGFGNKAVGTDSNWIVIKDLGQTLNTYLNVDGVEISNTVYQWINLTKFNLAPTFVSAGATETFKVACREGNLFLDSFAFIPQGRAYSSNQLSSFLGQNLKVPSSIVGISAESGNLGLSYTISANASALGGNVLDTVSTQYATPPSNDWIASYTVSIPQGYYDLYVRYWATDGNGDSFFVGNGFGVKTPGLDSDWRTIVKTAWWDVDGVSLSYKRFHWVKMTLSQRVPVFYSDGQAQTFFIGGREKGMLIDAFAFAPYGSQQNSTNLSNAVH